MSYAALSRLGVTFRPIDQWPGQPNPDRRHSPFLASLADTVNVLERELRMLDARQVVIQVALDERDIRLDGFPKSGRLAAHPGVILAFESKWGPLQYATDEFWSWEDNLRGVALAMEALRKVDRYGVSKRGEQYVGWKAIPQFSGGFQSREQAQQWIEEHGGYREAARTLHPDNAETGDEEEFKKLQQARELVGAR
jgi:hypothetical protein